MAKVKVIHDIQGETLTVYFDEPRENQICEEAGNGVILIKDKDSNQVIGFEKMYFKPSESESLVLEGEQIPAGGKE